MFLYFLRHASAGQQLSSAKKDEKRGLDKDGIEQCGYIGRALAALGVPAAEAVMVGDRIDTDIVMGRRLGLGTVLVLSGVTRADDPRIAAVAPDHVVRSIEDLVE